MNFNWSKYDEMSDEYTCQHGSIIAQMYRVPFTNKWMWYINNQGSMQEGTSTCANDAFLAVEEQILLLITPLTINKGNCND